MRKLLIIVLLLFAVGLQAQDIKISTKDNDLKLAALPYYSYGKGLGITSADSLFQLNIRFRMQNRIGYIQNEGEDAAYDGQIRRLRLRFDGYVGNPHFLYVLQLSFAPGDVGEIHEGENINIIRDAAVIYRPNRNWSFTFGQTKIPGNRQRVNSSGALQLTDRSINNAKFNIDRDFGIQAYFLNEKKDAFSYNIKTAVTTGEGRNWTKSPDNGVALTGKIELFPLGSFTKDGSNFEGDLAREKTPKLLLSGAFHQNNNARRTQGQLGDDLYQQKTMKSFFADAMLKYNGWAAMATYMSRTANNPIAIDPLDPTLSNYVYTGKGMDYQLSYTFPTNYEIIGRFSTQTANKDIKALTPDTNEYTIGVTKYLWEHAFKLQTELTYDQLDFANGTTKNNWYVRFQIEIGI
ncbi:MULTISPECIES: porin [unclassified Flavobacterium]|uniref:porin n=1 Tax=unclassified Flavobacterium TaxID=196869 RepID=UPI00086E4A4A|nr:MULTISPECIES: porin [unclassified Flavobacterium]MBN9284206.1 porin [Flavobacterium sp.]ODS83374.1 MAG: porin [Chryseobacterium sp. SCN 40-13]OJV70711.1 MAG: porin [Flavobacterium sp. 40-81]